MSLPLVSVIIPTYNGSPWIRDTLNSVLAQNYTNIETVVVDNCSSDNTLEVLSEFGNKIRVVSESRSGIGCARNKGLSVANGDFIAFLDHDDLWLPSKLTVEMEYFASSQISVVYADAEEFDSSGVVHRSFFELFPRLRNLENIPEMLIRHIVPLMSTVVVRASTVREHQIKFSDQASGVDDLGFLFEIALHGGGFAFTQEVLARRRLHANNLSKNHFNRFNQRVNLFQQLLQKFNNKGMASKELAWGLRQAHFRTGEWHWGQRNMVQARHHLKEAIWLDRQGLRSAVYYLSTTLPLSVISAVKNWQK